MAIKDRMGTKYPDIEKFEKAFRSHKYIRREGSAGSYKYFYRDASGKEVESDKVPRDEEVPGLAGDRASLARYKESLKKLESGEKVENLTIENAKKTIEGIQQAIENKLKGQSKEPYEGEHKDKTLSDEEVASHKKFIGDVNRVTVKSKLNDVWSHYYEKNYFSDKDDPQMWMDRIALVREDGMKDDEILAKMKNKERWKDLKSLDKEEITRVVEDKALEDFHTHIVNPIKEAIKKEDMESLKSKLRNGQIVSQKVFKVLTGMDFDAWKKGKETK